MQACLFEDTDSLRRLRLAAVAGRERSAGRFRGRSGSGLPHAGKSHPSLPPAPKLDALALPLAGPGERGGGARFAHSEALYKALPAPPVAL